MLSNIIIHNIKYSLLAFSFNILSLNKKIDKLLETQIKYFYNSIYITRT